MALQTWLVLYLGTANMAMPDVTNGLQKLRKARQDQDDLIAAAEEIARIGGLERAAQEAEAAMIPVRRKQEKANAELTAAQQKVTAAAQRVLDLQEEASIIEDEYAKKLAAGDRKAAKLVADARVEAQRIKDEGKEEAIALQEEMNQLKSQRDTLRSQVTDLTGQLKSIKEQKIALVRRLSE